MDKTTLYNVDEIRTALIQTTLDEVAFILKEKGYNPVNQIVGYLVSGDPGYITNYKDARKKILTLERNEVLQVILKEYLEIE